jgi:pimeloyl-ACP methyl ester carboxylesterase
MKKKTVIFGIIFLSISIVLLYIFRIGNGSKTNITGEYKIIKASGFRFQVLTKGKTSGTPVILLHGFPETASMWKNLMKDLAAKGFYCIAPNQRGYSPGARPQRSEDYRYTLLMKDVLNLADALKIKKFHLITHDWGCAVGWGIAAQYPQRIYTFTALSIPHIEAFRKAYKNSKEQYTNSQYIRFFRIPLLPEFLLARNDYSLLKKLYTHHNQSEIKHYIKFFSDTYALSGAINWYRANYQLFDTGFSVGNVADTCFIHLGKEG